VESTAVQGTDTFVRPIAPSMTRFRSGVMEMGRKSTCCLGTRLSGFVGCSHAGLFPLTWDHRGVKGMVE